MAPKGDKHLGYPVHGTGLASIREGFVAINMPEHRRDDAYKLVGEVLAANHATTLRWYLVDSTQELCCWWDDHERNVMWVRSHEVHIDADETLVTRPPRSTTYHRSDGDYVGWLLPGGEMGTGGGSPTSQTAFVLCRREHMQVPAGSVCPWCEVVHG